MNPWLGTKWKTKQKKTNNDSAKVLKVFGQDKEQPGNKHL